ncbi:MAG: aldo/keto reductase [Blautia sp.]|nr:aldo/keto reductase [Blautia sp.]
MKYIKCSGEACPISKIGLGVARFGTRIEKAESFEMLDYFVKKGGTVLDTARNYYEWVENGRGKSEACIGEWMERAKVRDQIWLVTKGGVKNDGKRFWADLSSDTLLLELLQSLEALRTDYLNVYLLHRDEPDRPVEEIVETMQMLAERGKIAQIGVANWRIERIKAANRYAERNHLKKLTVVQTWWSLAEYTDAMWDDETTTHMDDETYFYLKKEGLLAMAYSSQCKGFFQKAIAEGIDHVDSFLKKRIVTQANMKKLQYIDCFCKEHKVSPTAFVNAYITSNPLEGIALVSCSHLGQLKDIVEHSDYELERGAIEEINKVD